MHLHWKTIIPVCLGLSVFLTAPYFGLTHRESKEWGALIAGLPEKIRVSDALQSTVYYVLKQTHEPILRKDDGQNYHSKILRSWRRSLDSREYELCLRDGLRFNSGTGFTRKDFALHVSALSLLYDAATSVTERGGCVVVQFKKPRSGYLEHLTLYENSPTVKRSDIVEDGLGAFFLESISSEEIVLSRKDTLSRGYNRIAIYNYKGATDPKLRDRGIKDFNMIPLSQVPSWVMSEYHQFTTPELKSVILSINHPSKVVRQAVYNCVSVIALREAYFPLKKDFYDIQTILPIGMPGADPGLPKQNCKRIETGNKSGIALKFADWRGESMEALRQLMRDVESRSGVAISVEDFPPEKFDRGVLVSPHPYNLSVLVVDAVRPNDTAFLSPFCSNNKCFDVTIPVAERGYERMLTEENQKIRDAISVDIARELSKEYVVLPLYQNVRKLYYPKEIKQLGVGRGFLQYPEVADFRW